MLDLPGIFLASLATLCLGAVLGPEAPLIAIGSGLGVLAVHLVKKDAPPMAALVIGAAGSFAAIATLLGSPIVGAFLLMEASGIGGPLLGVVLVPGLVSAGIGSLIFVGLDRWTGFGTFSLSIGTIPHFGSPTVGEFLWAIGIGVGAAILGTLIKRGALALQPVVEARKVLLTPLVGLVVATLAIVFTEITGKPFSDVLFSGQSALPGLVRARGGLDGGSIGGAHPLQGPGLQHCRSAASEGDRYSRACSSARRAASLLSHLPGLPMIAGVGMGIGAVSVAMLGLPLVSVLLAALLLQADGLSLTPLIIVAVVVSYVVSAHLTPAPSLIRVERRHQPVRQLRPRRPRGEAQATLGRPASSSLVHSPKRPT